MMGIRVSIVLALVLVGVVYSWQLAAQETPAPAPTTVTLPAAQDTNPLTLEQALRQRRSARAYGAAPLTLAQVSQLLWAAQGITEPNKGLRTAPSAMASYPLRVYLIAGHVTGLPAGAYRYVPRGHTLELVTPGDQRTNAGAQPQMQHAAALIIYAADTTAIAQRTNEQLARQWAAIEIGHSAQNVLLEEVALGLVGVPMGGYDAAKLKPVLKLPETEELYYVVSAGTKP